MVFFSEELEESVVEYARLNERRAKVSLGKYRHQSTGSTPGNSIVGGNYSGY